jgi:ethanolamine utilization protein EutA (predicted chaperonin)
MCLMMMSGGFGARPRGINRSDKAKERNRERDRFCYNDFGLFFGKTVIDRLFTREIERKFDSKNLMAS